MNWQQMFKGDFIAATEMGDKQPTLTIRDVKPGKVEDEKGRAKVKGIVFFREVDRPWILCKTNAMCIAGMFGDDVSGWVGKRVTLYSTIVNVGKEKAPGIRVKGSPDIAAPVSVGIKLPRKKPFSMRMQVTKPGEATAVESPPDEPETAPDEEPIVDPATGETF